jgi:hypothetical protein
MANSIECKHCIGAVNLDKGTPLRIGCHSSRIAFPCKSCGRLHWEDGNLVTNRQGARAFLIDNKIVHKNKKGEILN